MADKDEAYMHEINRIEGQLSAEEARITANRITLGRNLHAYASGNREVFFTEERLTCGPIEDRLLNALENIGPPDAWPADLQCVVHWHGAVHLLDRNQILEVIQQ